MSNYGAEAQERGRVYKTNVDLQCKYILHDTHDI